MSCNPSDVEILSKCACARFDRARPWHSDDSDDDEDEGVDAREEEDAVEDESAESIAEEYRGCGGVSRLRMRARTIVTRCGGGRGQGRRGGRFDCRPLTL